MVKGEGREGKVMGSISPANKKLIIKNKYLPIKKKTFSLLKVNYAVIRHFHKLSQMHLIQS